MNIQFHFLVSRCSKKFAEPKNYPTIDLNKGRRTWWTSTRT